MELALAARVAVLLACGVAGGALFVLAASPWRAQPRPAEPGPMAGLAPAVLAVFILLAGGTVLTGAGMLDVGLASAVAQAAGIGLLAVAGLVAAKSAFRVLRAPTAPEAAVVPSPLLLVLAWAGAALATVSWVLAVGAVGVAALAGVSVEGRRQ